MLQIIDLNGSSCLLDGLDVNVEPRTFFRLDLPDRKTVNIDCKIDSTIGQEIGPILSSYGYKTELVTLCSVSIFDLYYIRTNMTSLFFILDQ